MAQFQPHQIVRCCTCGFQGPAEYCFTACWNLDTSCFEPICFSCRATREPLRFMKGPYNRKVPAYEEMDSPGFEYPDIPICLSPVDYDFFL